MTVDIFERLTRADIVIDGDVHPIADANDPDIEATSHFPMTNAERIAHMHPHDPHQADLDEYYKQVDAEEQRQVEIRQVRSENDFTQRNNYLVGAARKTARANSHAGAASMLADGKYIDGYDGRSEIAEEAESRARAKSLELVSKACGSCALRELCPLTPEQLVERLHERSDRNRFSTRVKKASNDQLCEDNLSPKRLSK